MKIVKSDLQLDSLVSRIRANELDLQPDFQRGEVWDRKRRQRLIDTLLREWYVPAVHIVEEEDGSEVVLDGQQRIAAIRDFFDNKLKVDGNIEPLDPRIQDLHGLTFSKLPPRVQRSLERFVMQVITLTEYDPDEPNELFFRLNQSYNLTPPEKRNALHGESRDEVKALVRRLTSSGLLSRGAIGFSNGRLAYDDIVARTCVAVDLDNLRKHINNTTVEDYYRRLMFKENTISRVETAAGLLKDQIDAAMNPIKFNKGSLQTWLVYFAWLSTQSYTVDPQLLARFETDRGIVRLGEYEPADAVHRALQEILRLYDDRASYRVTDVSSVLVRDLAIQLYAEIESGAPSRRGTAELITSIAAEPRRAQTLVTDFLERSSWGDPLFDGEFR
ncbi:DUF262 domain-containing protein [Microbacterium esteraromaticum]|uniref:DUF262 domain-containing protein n=1 Tax=Microbacterium esteraromaticum TaxID=57043 RepID=UPI003242E3BB